MFVGAVQGVVLGGGVRRVWMRLVCVLRSASVSINQSSSSAQRWRYFLRIRARSCR